MLNLRLRFMGIAIVEYFKGDGNRHDDHQQQSLHVSDKSGDRTALILEQDPLPLHSDLRKLAYDRIAYMQTLHDGVPMLSSTI